MRKKMLTLFSVAIITMLAALTVVEAESSDLVWDRLMRNTHDVLAIGEITDLSNEFCVMKVHSTIVSTQGDREQLKPEVIELKHVYDGWAKTWSYVGNNDLQCKVGDYVLVSADKERNSSYFTGNMYKVSSLDKTDLSIEISSLASAAFKKEVAMIEDFVHSDGRYNEFEVRTTNDEKSEQVFRFSDKSHTDGV